MVKIVFFRESDNSSLEFDLSEITINEIEELSNNGYRIFFYEA